MDAKRCLGRFGTVLALAVILMASQGCNTAVGRYFQYRGEDALEMADVGLTITKKPSVGLYWNSLDLLVFGYSDIDGYFVGLGGGQIGMTRHYNKCAGLMVSEERVGWGNFDKTDPNTLSIRNGGLLGFASLMGGKSTPDYTPACVHFFPHIAYVGFVWNARWTQMIDFMLGFTTLDLAGDDGYKFGVWPAARRPAGRI